MKLEISNTLENSNVLYCTGNALNLSISKLWLPDSDKLWTGNRDEPCFQSFPNWQFITSNCSQQNLTPIEMLTFLCLIKIFYNILCEYIVQLAIISEDIPEGDK